MVGALHIPSVSEPFLAWTTSGEVDFQEREDGQPRLTNRMRMNHARQLLRETKKSVVEIALEVGFVELVRVFDRVVGLDGVPDGYRAMNEREAIKVLVKP